MPPLSAADPLRVPVLGVLPLGRPARVGVHPDLKGNIFLVVIYKLFLYLQTLGKLFASSPNKGCLDFLFDQSRIEFMISIQFTVHSVRCT